MEKPSKKFNLKATVLIEIDGQKSYMETLYRREIEVLNKGSVDRSDFSFGITLPKGEVAVYAAVKSSDRHHKLTGHESICPANKMNQIDLKAEPFNRGDYYTIVIYTCVNPPNAQPGSATLGSSAPVKFVEASASSLSVLATVPSGALAMALGSAVQVMVRPVIANNDDRY